MSVEPIYIHSFRAMATYFEFALWGKAPSYLRSVAEEAEAEVHRIERHLSMYREDSEIYEANVRAFHRPVPLDPRTYALLLRAKELSDATNGAFDITIAPLLQAWGFVGGTGATPDASEVEEALKLTGMKLLEFDDEYRTIRFKVNGMRVDLGAIGKGYAIDQVVELLRDMEIPGALIHGGTSSVAALGCAPDGEAYSVAIQHPADPEELIDVVKLTDASVSVSAVHGKSFEDGGVEYGHVIDPTTGRPTRNAVLAAVIAPQAADGDALSTALLISGLPLLNRLRSIVPNVSGLVTICDAEGNIQTTSRL